MRSVKLGLICALSLLFLLISSEALTRSPHKLWRLLESGSTKRVKRALLQTRPPVEALDTHNNEERDLRLFQNNNPQSVKADPAVCKGFCQRDYNDAVTYKCSVRLCMYQGPKYGLWLAGQYLVPRPGNGFGMAWDATQYSCESLCVCQYLSNLCNSSICRHRFWATPTSVRHA